MNIKLKHLFLIPYLFFFFSSSFFACDETSTVVNGIVNNGDGTFTVTITACMEPNDFSGSADYFFASFTGANTISASPSTLSYSDGTVHTLNAISGTNGDATWSGSTVSTFVSQTCFTVSIVLDGMPTGLSTENGRSSCSHTATFPTTVNLTCTSSGGVFTDSGGAAGNYGSNQNIVTTICPDSPGGVVSVAFSGIVNSDSGFGSCEDILSIYQGQSTAGTFVGAFCELNTSPGTIVSTDPSGCLTFQFVSDGSTNRPGWNATVTCSNPCNTSATLSGSSSICSGNGTNLSVALTGTPPWSITYTDGTTPVTVNGINASPFVINVTPTSTKTYSLTAVSNAQCAGTFSGTATVSVSTALAPTYTMTSTGTTCAGPNTGSITINPSSANTTFDWVSGPIVSPIPAGNLPGGASDERALTNLPVGTYCVDITRNTNSTTNSVIFSETFETGGTNWTINNSSGANIFVINNTYPGGTCVTGLGPFTVPVVPNQPAAVTAGPNSNYLHIMATTTSGLTCGGGSTTPFPPLNANFDGATSDQKVTMNTPISTLGMTNVVVSFYWLAQGETSGQDDFGSIEYSLNGGAFVQIGAKLRNQTTWINTTLTDPSWSNQASLVFRIRWQNDASSSVDPPLAIDQFIVTADVTTSCPSTVQECFTLVAPANITPTFTALAAVCQNAAAPVLPLTSLNGITGTWSPAVSTATSGTKTFTFTPNAGQCGLTTTITLLVNPILTPAITCGTLTTTSVQFNWVALAGAANYAVSYSINGAASINGGTIATTTFTVTGLSPADNVVITVTPTGTGCYLAGTGNCTSNNCVPPVITVQPIGNQTICEGLPTNFDVTVTGGTNFQWQISTDNGTSYTNLSNGGIYSNVTTNNLAISDVTGLNGNIYQLVVTAADPLCPATTNPALTLTVTPRTIPLFTQIQQFVKIQ